MKILSMPSLIALAAGLAVGVAHASLPPPTPAQQQAAADKKAKDAADAAKAKEELAASMDAVAAHYRQRAAAQGWKTHPPVAIAAASSATSATGVSAPNTGNAPAGQPNGQLTPAGANAPIRSEKLGTAPPSTDVKSHPTLAVPAGTPPAVVKDTPKVKNK
jgi:colicin import membrane protein